MIDDPRHLDPIEEMLSELGDAEQAGVFRRTFVDAGSLVRERPDQALSQRLSHHKLIWMPAAACIALVVCIGTLVHKAGFGPDGHSQIMGSLSSANMVSPLAGFYDCITGPGGAVDNGCVAYDYDSDGDVDLADYSNLPPSDRH